MTRRLDPARFDRLAVLQNLATLERRRALEGACIETDHRAGVANEAAQVLSTADATLERVYAEERICLDRLRLAAWIVADCERILDRSEHALDEAKAEEHEAGLQWIAARHRTEWFGDQARTLQKKKAGKRDDRAENDARSLRLALRRDLA